MITLLTTFDFLYDVQHNFHEGEHVYSTIRKYYKKKVFRLTTGKIYAVVLSA